MAGQSLAATLGTTPRGIFTIAAVLIVLRALLAIIVLKEPRRDLKETKNVAWEYSSQRCMAAQASLYGLVLKATATWKARGAG